MELALRFFEHHKYSHVHRGAQRSLGVIPPLNVSISFSTPSDWKYGHETYLTQIFSVPSIHFSSSDVFLCAFKQTYRPVFILWDFRFMPVMVLYQTAPYYNFSNLKTKQDEKTDIFSCLCIETYLYVLYTLVIFLLSSVS